MALKTTKVKTLNKTTMQKNYFSLRFCELRKSNGPATFLFLCDHYVYAFGKDAFKVSSVIGSKINYRLDLPNHIQARTSFCCKHIPSYLTPLVKALGTVALNDPLLNATDQKLYDSLKESL